MKDYEHKQVTVPELKTITCNKCGTKHANNGDPWNDEIVSQLFHEFSIYHGYSSDYDGETWEFDLCENCIVEFVESFKIKPKRR